MLRFPQIPCWFFDAFGTRKGLLLFTESSWNTKTVLWESVWKNTCDAITWQSQEFKFPETKQQNASWQSESMKCIYQVFYEKSNCHKFFIMIIFIHNLQNWKVCKVLIHYLAERSEGSEVFEGLSQTVYTDEKTPNATRDCIKKTL